MVLQTHALPSRWLPLKQMPPTPLAVATKPRQLQGVHRRPGSGELVAGRFLQPAGCRMLLVVWPHFAGTRSCAYKRHLA